MGRSDVTSLYEPMAGRNKAQIRALGTCSKGGGGSGGAVGLLPPRGVQNR